MASRDPGGDPRLLPAGGAEAPPEASVRPVVAMRRSGPSGVAIGVGAVAAGLILFAVLNARRQSVTVPPVHERASDALTGSSAPPPLYIPPAPVPLPVVAAPLPAPPVPPPPAPAPPPQPRVVYVPQPTPIANGGMPPPQAFPPAPPPRSANAPTLVIDTTQAPVAPAPSAGTDGQANATPGVAPIGGGRARSGVFANRATTVPQGTLIPAVLETAFDSTRPGFARAIVSRDVRGFDGTQVLVPRGSRLVGEYRSEVAPGQRRALINWVRLIRPDGVTIAIGSPAADTVGRGGVDAHVNSHFFARFAGAILQSVLDVGVNIAASRAANGAVILALPGTVSGSTQQVFQPQQIVPTLRVAAGTSISIFVARDLDFSGANAERHP